MPILLQPLSICPRIRKVKGKLIAQSAWQVRLLSLGGLCREVAAHPKQEKMVIESRYFWLLRRRRRIPFRHIEAVTYGYGDWAAPTWSGPHQSADTFSVGLRLHGGEELHLFYFYGGGTFSNEGPWPDWLYWKECLIEVSGTQQEESRAFVDLLSKMIGVPVVPPRP